MILHGGTSFFLMSCRMCQSCFTAVRAKARVADFRLRPAGATPAKTESWNTAVGLRQTYMTLESCWLRHQPSSRMGFCSRQGYSIQLQRMSVPQGVAWSSESVPDERQRTLEISETRGVCYRQTRPVPFRFSVIEVVGGRNCLACAKL